jgi:hypothetical protein
MSNLEKSLGSMMDILTKLAPAPAVAEPVVPDTNTNEAS